MPYAPPIALCRTWLLYLLAVPADSYAVVDLQSELSRTLVKPGVAKHSPPVLDIGPLCWNLSLPSYPFSLCIRLDLFNLDASEIFTSYTDICN